MIVKPNTLIGWHRKGFRFLSRICGLIPVLEVVGVWVSYAYRGQERLVFYILFGSIEITLTLLIV